MGAVHVDDADRTARRRRRSDGSTQRISGKQFREIDKKEFKLNQLKNIKSSAAVLLVKHRLLHRCFSRSSALREEAQLLYSLRRDHCITPFSIIRSRSPCTYRSLHLSPHLPTPPVPSLRSAPRLRVKQCFFRYCFMLRFRRTIGCSIHARAAATPPISSDRVQVARGGHISRCVHSSSTFLLSISGLRHAPFHSVTTFAA